MGVDPFTVAIAAISLVGTAVSANEQRKASKQAAAAQERARKAQQARENMEAQRERRKQIREAQQKRARIIATGEAAGVSGSSGVTGGAGGVNTQLGSNVGFLNSSIAANNLASQELQTAANFESKAQKYATYGSLTNSLFEQAGGFDTLGAAGKKLFS